MTKFYTVYTRHFKGRPSNEVAAENGPEKGEVVEVVKRTDEKTAKQDMELVKDICRRPAWIEEEDR